MFMLFSLTANFIKVNWYKSRLGNAVQSPIFIIFLIILLLLFTIISFDLIKINFIQKYMKIKYLESQFLKNNIFISNFFTGVLSTLLATPCTAPLVGTIISSCIITKLFFIYYNFLTNGFWKILAISCFYYKPNLLWYLPKPGVWIKYIKFIIGGLLAISLLWLSSLLVKHYPILSIIIIMLINLLIIVKGLKETS